MKDNLKTLIRQSIKSGVESDVSSACLGVLEVSGKTLANGYKIIPEYNYGGGRPDIVVRVIKDSRLIMLFECKGQGSNLKDAKNQIRKYLSDLNCEIGFLVYPDRFFIYKHNKNVILYDVLDMEDDIDDIITLVSNII